jgi:hypothetical protein
MAVRNLTDAYIAYFRDKAINHKKILHQVTVLPNGDIEDVLGQCTFDVLFQNEIKDIEIAREDIRPDADFILLAVLPTPNTEEREDANHQNNYFGGFIVLKKASRRDTKKKLFWKGIAEAEDICNDILNRMVADSNNKHPLFSRSIDRIDKTKSRKLERNGKDNWVGFLCTFSFHNILTICPDPTVWADGGLTPHNIKL